MREFGDKTKSASGLAFAAVRDLSIVPSEDGAIRSGTSIFGIPSRSPSSPATEKEVWRGLRSYGKTVVSAGDDHPIQVFGHVGRPFEIDVQGAQ